MPQSRTIEDLLSQYTVDANGCWLWNRGRTSSRYGSTTYEGARWLAHRLSYMYHVGRIPDGLHVLHRCDNPPCINPDHLFLGTHTDNMRDSNAKERNGSRTRPEKLSRGDAHYSRTRPEKLARGATHGSQTCPEKLMRGEKASWSKLTEDKVRQMRQLHTGGVTSAEIGRMFGVSQVAAYAAVTGKNWAHV